MGINIADTLWLFNAAMEHGPFIDGFYLLKMVIFHGYVSHNQMVYVSWGNWAKMGSAKAEILELSSVDPSIDRQTDR